MTEGVKLREDTACLHRSQSNGRHTNFSHSWQRGQLAVLEDSHGIHTSKLRQKRRFKRYREGKANRTRRLVGDKTVRTKVRPVMSLPQLGGSVNYYIAEITNFKEKDISSQWKWVKLRLLSFTDVNSHFVLIYIWHMVVDGSTLSLQMLVETQTNACLNSHRQLGHGEVGASLDKPGKTNRPCCMPGALVLTT